jgi:uncharacterized membrane protein
MTALKRRLLAKTVTYKVASLLSGILILGIATGSWAFASGIALTLLVVNTLLYLWHEHIWNGIDWGRVSDEDSG